jgi:glutathione S-transferase
MIQVHHLNSSRSMRIIWMLEELGVSYQIVSYQRDAKTLLAPPAMKAVHPLGKSPILQDGALILAESGAILTYLQERYDSTGIFMPSEQGARVQYHYWLHYAEGSLMPVLVMKFVFSRLGKAPVPWLLRPLTGAIGYGIQRMYLDRELAQHACWMDQYLAQSPWFAGKVFSVADIQMSFPVEMLALDDGLAHYPNIAQWLARIQGRAAYQRAREKGGDFDITG